MNFIDDLRTCKKMNIEKTNRMSLVSKTQLAFGVVCVILTVWAFLDGAYQFIILGMCAAINIWMPFDVTD